MHGANGTHPIVSVVIPAFQRWLSDAVSELGHGNPAQNFVRINSNTTFERLREDPGFRAVVNSLADFGI
jgi:hypothetical protein